MKLFIFLKKCNLFILIRLITLQYCIGFIAHQHESTGVHIFPIQANNLVILSYDYILHFLPMLFVKYKFILF